MTASAGEAPSPTAVTRADVDHGRRLATYWVDRAGFSLLEMVNLYEHAGDLLTELLALAARDSRTEGTLVERVERHAHTVAAEPEMDAAIGFFDRDDEDGLVRITSVPQHCHLDDSCRAEIAATISA